jgi:hypothetical protein
MSATHSNGAARACRCSHPIPYRDGDEQHPGCAKCGHQLAPAAREWAGGQGVRDTFEPLETDGPPASGSRSRAPDKDGSDASEPPFLPQPEGGPQMDWPFAAAADRPAGGREGLA